VVNQGTPVSGFAAQPDDELVRMAALGVEPVMAELYGRHRARLFGYLYRMAGDRDLAEEVLQAVFLRFFQRPAEAGPRGNVESHLLRMARGRLEELRRSRPKATAPPDRPSEVPQMSNGPEEENDRQREAVRTGIEQLSPEIREVVVLRLFQGCDDALIAEVTGAAAADIRSRTKTALRAVRRAVAPGAATRPETSPPISGVCPTFGEEDLMDFIQDRLSRERKAEFEAHSGRCAACTGALQDLRLIARLAKGPAIQPRMKADWAIREIIRAESRRKGAR
jgi:RNA polymerase sigma factor (sigma-70 family)